jgi:hypothetical protein
MAELPLSGRLVAGVGVAFAAAAGVHAWVARRSPRASALVRELPAPYLGLTYALFRVLPPLAFARLALEEPAMWVVAGAAALSALVDSWHSVRYRYE